VINNSIKIDITAEADRPFPGPDQQDTGTLTLTPGNPSTATWVCSNCPNGFFNAVVGCAQAGGCTANDVLEWLVGVQVQAGGGGPPNFWLPKIPDRVLYAIDSDDLGNGKRYHASPADCNTTVTPADYLYGATDLRQGFDLAILCSDNGVTIGLTYEE
jgi:hypothetical protein